MLKPFQRRDTFSLSSSEAEEWRDPLDKLRRKWHVIPAGGARRASSSDLIKLTDAELLEKWQRSRRNAIEGAGFGVRGWYNELYVDVLSGKKVMDFGSGFGIDSIHFAQRGARMTFVDIVESNLRVLRRLCSIQGVEGAGYCYLENLDSLRSLDTDYDVLWAQGSLINLPFELMREEVAVLVGRLPIGGRLITLAYPRERWVRDGRQHFRDWGETTDGPGTPWVEWYDLDRMRALFAPAEFDVVLYFNFDNDNFNWFDLIRTA